MATRKAAVAVKAPKGPDELLKSVIKKLDITQSNAAELMGMQVQNLHRYLTGERRVTAKLAKRAEKYLGSEVISAAKLIRAQAEVDIYNLDSVVV
jgi:plasmid maintenance system antidote protein VapI